MACFLRAAVVMAIVSSLLTACASRAQFPASFADLILVGDLHRPDKTGQLPAVVLLAPCGGVTRHMSEWANWLNSQGYVTLIVDSFSPRHSLNACEGGRPTVPQAAGDAVDALTYLTTLPFVDRNRVAVMGWSHGGSAALLATSSNARSRLGFGDEPPFRAAVAFYPACMNLDSHTKTPTLLLLAGRDDWTPAGQCVAIGEAPRLSEARVSWELYPNALHAFDRPDATAYLGHAMAYDREAAAASHTAVQKFLVEYLRAEP